MTANTSFFTKPHLLHCNKAVPDERCIFSKKGRLPTTISGHNGAVQECILPAVMRDHGRMYSRKGLSPAVPLTTLDAVVPEWHC